jgi:hypothetical protein
VVVGYEPKILFTPAPPIPAPLKGAEMFEKRVFYCFPLSSFFSVYAAFGKLRPVVIPVYYPI